MRRLDHGTSLSVRPRGSRDAFAASSHSVHLQVTVSLAQARVNHVYVCTVKWQGLQVHGYDFRCVLLPMVNA